jgi:predicted DNA-binding transcriptional regulator AlpA
MTSPSPTGAAELSHRFLSPDEVAALLPGVSRNTLAMWRYEHKGPKYYKLGRKVIYALDDVEAWVAASEVSSAS